ncbi:MAG: hypothetical protein QM820_19845 [Minicystis sp.]
MLDATERKALTLSAFAASCLCFAPGQIVSGAVLLLAAVLLWRWDQRLLREAEEAEGAGGPKAGGAPSVGDQG